MGAVGCMDVRLSVHCMNTTSKPQVRREVPQVAGRSPSGCRGRECRPWQDWPRVWGPANLASTRATVPSSQRVELHGRTADTPRRWDARGDGAMRHDVGGPAGAAGVLLLGAALLGDFTPLQASAPGPGIRLVDLSDYPTHTTVDRFEVEVSNLSATAAYQVIVSSDSAGLGIGACGTASQTETVTGVAAQTLTFFLYVCTEDSGTLTAELRRTGASTAEAAVNQRLSVVAIPDEALADARGATRNVARAGTPGIVSGIHFDTVMNTEFRAKWSPPSDGGDDLTGYGILLWTGDVVNDKPDYDHATTIGVPTTFEENGIEKQAQTLTGLPSGTTHHYLMHACNDSGCGHWSYPAKQVMTTGTPPDPEPAPGTTTPPSTSPVPAPHRPHTIMFHDTTSTSVRVTWRAADNTGGVPLTGFDLRYWPYDSQNPDSEHGATTQRADGGSDRSETVEGLDANREYELKMRACNRPHNSNCSPWSADHRFTTTAGTGPPVLPPGAFRFSATVAAQVYRAGQLVSVQLPAATGGAGHVTYRLSPAMGNGLSFDGPTRTVAGTPQAAANRATYTYTVTDAANNTAQIPFHVTVFDVNVVEAFTYKSLAASTWGVLDYAVVVMREAGFTRRDGHQFRLRLPASTGFQAGRECQWPAAPPTATTMLESLWVDSNVGLYLVRCGLGSGARINFEVEVRLGTGGTAESLYTATTTIPRSWHRHDQRVLYYIIHHRDSRERRHRRRPDVSDQRQHDAAPDIDRSAQLSQCGEGLGKRAQRWRHA